MPRRNTQVGWLVVGLAMLVAVGSACCARQSAGWADQAARLSQEADRAIAEADPDRAIRSLQALLALPRPAEVTERDHRVVLQDGLWRLSEIELGRGHPDQARAYAERGLALGETHDLFHANLLAARGQAWEALGEDRRAAQDLQAAQRLNEALLQEALAQPSEVNR